MIYYRKQEQARKRLKAMYTADDKIQERVARKNVWRGSSFAEREYNQKVVGRNMPGTVPSYAQYKNNQIRRTRFSRIKRSVGNFIFGGSNSGRRNRSNGRSSGERRTVINVYNGVRKKRNRY